jgi:hypothetical protein
MHGLLPFAVQVLEDNPASLAGERPEQAMGSGLYAETIALWLWIRGD